MSKKTAMYKHEKINGKCEKNVKNTGENFNRDNINFDKLY